MSKRADDNTGLKVALGVATLLGVWAFARSASAEPPKPTSAPGTDPSDPPLPIGLDETALAAGDALDAYLFSGTAAQQGLKKRWMWALARLYLAGWSQIVPSVGRIESEIRVNDDYELDPSLSLALGRPARAREVNDLREFGRRSPVSVRKPLPMLLTDRTIAAIRALDAEYRG